MANTIQYSARVKLRRDTSANWESNNPTLLEGEVIIIYTDSGETKFKVGDGITHYANLPYLCGSAVTIHRWQEG